MNFLLEHGNHKVFGMPILWDGMDTPQNRMPLAPKAFVGGCMKTFALWWNWVAVKHDMGEMTLRHATTTRRLSRTARLAWRPTPTITLLLLGCHVHSSALSFREHKHCFSAGVGPFAEQLFARKLGGRKPTHSSKSPAHSKHFAQMG